MKLTRMAGVLALAVIATVAALASPGAAGAAGSEYPDEPYAYLRISGYPLAFTTFWWDASNITDVCLHENGEQPVDAVDIIEDQLANWNAAASVTALELEFVGACAGDAPTTVCGVTNNSTFVGIEVAWVDDYTYTGCAQPRYYDTAWGELELVQVTISATRTNTCPEWYDDECYTDRDIVLHELGHAIGIGHPYDDEWGDPGSLSCTEASVMCTDAAHGQYDCLWWNTCGGVFAYPTALDIEVATNIYRDADQDGCTGAEEDYIEYLFGDTLGVGINGRDDDTPAGWAGEWWHDYADINEDRYLNVLDLSAEANHVTSPPSFPTGSKDINRDNVINVNDLSLMATQINNTASGYHCRYQPQF